MWQCGAARVDVYHTVLMGQPFVVGMAADYDVHRTVEPNSRSDVVDQSKPPAFYVQCVDCFHPWVVHSEVVVAHCRQHRGDVLQPVQDVGCYDIAGVKDQVHLMKCGGHLSPGLVDGGG